MGVKNSGRKWLENLEMAMSLLLLQKIASKYSGIATTMYAQLKTEKNKSVSSVRKSGLKFIARAEISEY